jgi:hypothetical protein
MTARSWGFAAGLGLGVATLSPALRAEPATQGALQLGIGFRYGVDLNDSELNPWGTGLGVDVGYTLKNAVYVGGNFEYFFGESLASGGAEDLTFNVWQWAAEGGYDVGLGDSIVIRPKLGLGSASFMGGGCFGSDSASVCAGDSQSAFALFPGATFLLLTRTFSLSFDARYELAFTDPKLSKALIFSLGIGF